MTLQIEKKNYATFALHKFNREIKYFIKLEKKLTHIAGPLEIQRHRNSRKKSFP